MMQLMDHITVLYEWECNPQTLTFQRLPTISWRIQPHLLHSCSFVFVTPFVILLLRKVVCFVLFCFVSLRSPKPQHLLCTFGIVGKPWMSSGAMRWFCNDFLNIWCRSYWILDNSVIKNSIKSKQKQKGKLGHIRHILEKLSMSRIYAGDFVILDLSYEGYWILNGFVIGNFCQESKFKIFLKS